jgi:allophanate hydrolase
MWDESATAAHPTDCRSVDGMPDDLDRIPLAVVGAHLAGERLHHQLTERGAALIATTTTSPRYRFHVLDEPAPARPALERVSDGSSIEVEVWALDAAGFGTFVAGVAPPLAIGSVELADGTWVSGFVCESGGLAGATDVTEYGGWRSWRAAQDQQEPSM